MRLNFGTSARDPRRDPRAPRGRARAGSGLADDGGRSPLIVGRRARAPAPATRRRCSTCAGRSATRTGTSTTSTGHIPGAVFVDLDRELSAPPSAAGGRHPLPALGDLQAAARRWGLREGGGVVLYDDSGGISAARGWWLLRWAGVRDVALLDGGLGAWTAAGLELERGEVVPAPGDVVLRAGEQAVLDADGAAALARDGAAARRARRRALPRRGRAGRLRAPGTSPARAAPRPRRTSTPTGASSPPTSCAGASRRSASPPASPVGVYCGSGVSAAHEIAALALAGYDAVLYPGSWSAWSADPARPAATGDQPGERRGRRRGGARGVSPRHLPITPPPGCRVQPNHRPGAARALGVNRGGIKMSHRLMGLCAALLVGGVLLAGCGGGGSSNSTTSTTTSTASSTATKVASQHDESTEQRDRAERCHRGDRGGLHEVDRGGGDAHREAEERTDRRCQKAARKRHRREGRAINEVCVDIVKDTVPSGSAQTLALASCKAIGSRTGSTAPSSTSVPTTPASTSANGISAALLLAACKEYQGPIGSVLPSNVKSQLEAACAQAKAGNVSGAEAALEGLRGLREARARSSRAEIETGCKQL